MLRTTLLLLALIPAAHAQTYKWVDDKGVVNYSNTPPPGASGNLQTVPDRISSYAPDPAVSQPVEIYRRLDANQAEWLQRQQLMALQQQAQMAAAPAEPAYYPAYYTSRRPLLRQPFFTPKPAPQVRQRPARVSFSRL